MPVASSNSTRVAPVISTCDWGMEAPRAGAVTATSTAHTSARTTANVCALRSDDDRHMSFKGHLLQRGVGPHAVCPNGQARLNQHNPATGGQSGTRHPLDGFRFQLPTVDDGPDHTPREFHGVGLTGVGGPGRDQVDLLLPPVVEPAR